MGTNNSKENSNLTLSTIDNSNYKWQTPVKNKSSIISKTTNYCGWQEISRCTHTDWFNGISGKQE